MFSGRLQKRLRSVKTQRSIIRRCRASILVAALAGGCSVHDCTGAFPAAFENRSDQTIVETWVVIYDERKVETSSAFPPGSSYELQVPLIAEQYYFHVRLESGIEHSCSVYIDTFLLDTPRLLIYSDRMEYEFPDLKQRGFGGPHPCWAAGDAEDGATPADRGGGVR